MSMVISEPPDYSIPEDDDYWDWFMDNFDPDGPHEEFLDEDLTDDPEAWYVFPISNPL
jgi:hypothetical protein